MAALRPFAVLVLLALALSGCSGKGGGGSSSSSSSAMVSASMSASMSGTMSPSPSASPSSSSSSSTGPAPLSGNVARDITDNNFPDGTFTVKVGTKVTWTDKGTNPHSVPANDGSFDSSPNCPPVCLINGQTFAVTFDKAGSVSYHCKIHANMVGTITVVA